MTSTTGPQPLAPESKAPRLTWIILGVAVVLVAIANLSSGSADTRDCRREARDNAAIVQTVGGEERYVEICMQAHEKVRQMQGARKP